ncbi:MAG: protein kinase domain-containing protein [Deltaproteobacteria bacterium]
MAEPAQSVRCPKCRFASPDPENFCPKCGTDLRGVGGFTDTSSWSLKGKVIADRYRILDRLGEGGMGAVYKVQHTRMGKVMALKLLRPELSKSRSASERFQQEAQLVARLSCVNTISIFDFGETEDGALFLAMEYLPGHDLSHLLRTEGPMPEARVAEIGAQVLRALAEAHDAGIVHRDIKPANVMLLRTREREDLVKVLDFGIAKLRERTGKGAITGVGDFVGTPEYLSPEQAKGTDIGPASDLYSLGAMLYELACGVPVFEGPTPLSIVSCHLSDRPVPPHERVPQLRCTPAFEAVLLRALEKSPGDRFATADEMREALEPLAGLRPVPSFSKATKDTGDLAIASREDWDHFERRLRRSFLLRNATALALLCSLAGGGAWAYRRFANAPPAALSEEKEPNDTPAQANLIASGQSIRGHIGARFTQTESDKDFFVLPVVGPMQLLRVRVTGLPGMSLVLDLFGPEQKTPLARVDDGAPGAGLVLPDWPVSEGRYYLELHAKVPPGQVPPENVSDFYTLTASLTEPLPGEELEPNDTPETASAAGLSQAALGFAGGLGEVDDWALDPLASDSDIEGTRLGAVVSAVPGAELQLRSGQQAVPAGTALWVHEQPDKLKRIVSVRVERGANVDDLYALSFFTPREDGGKAVLSAAQRLVDLGRKQDAAALVLGALRLCPDAPWAPAAKLLVGR